MENLIPDIRANIGMLLLKRWMQSLVMLLLEGFFFGFDSIQEVIWIWVFRLSVLFSCFCPRVTQPVWFLFSPLNSPLNKVSIA